MMEQPEVPTITGAPAIASVPIMSARALSDEARASLNAVREAQELARVRARRQTRQTRIGTGVLVAAGVLAALIMRPHAARRPTAALPVNPAVALAPPAPPLAVEPAPPEVAAHAPAPAPAPEPGCDAALVQKTPWLVTPAACQRMFAADPTNAPLALAIAQAEHARGNLAEGATWAKRALALDSNAAEAYVLIARADAADGRPDEARTAYRHYLALAPRGWHHAEARRGLH